MRFFSRWVRKGLRRFRWSIGKVCDRLQQLPQIYDVREEQVDNDRFLVHIWVNGLDRQVGQKLETEIRKAVSRRPRDIKLDVLLYRR